MIHKGLLLENKAHEEDAKSDRRVKVLLDEISVLFPPIMEISGPLARNIWLILEAEIL